MRKLAKSHARIDRREFIRRGTLGAGALVGGSLLGSKAAQARVMPRRTAAIHRPLSPVAVRRCKRYDRDLVHDQLGLMLADLGGLGVLVAGKNGVCTDAVCVGIMGHDPRAPAETGMFLSGLNHLGLAAARGVGNNDLSKIPVVGDPIASVRYDYYPPVNIADERLS